ncbi:uncharacterized protein LOC144578413 [Callithrix jacchus]
MGLRRASWCDQDSVRTPFRIVAGRGWEKPHTALLYWCVSSVHAPGHTGPAPASEPFRVPRTAQLTDPVRRCAPPPPQIQQRPPTTPRTHTRSRTLTVTRPAGGTPPRAPALAVPLRRAVQGRGARPWSPKAGLRGPLPLPAPPRRQRQVRVHNCQARPQPPPAGFPAPRDYRSCGGN